MDYRVTCRACLTQNPRAPMFALDDGDLREIFAECAKLQTRKNDQYPQQLCCTCRSKCLKWNSFKEMVHETDRKLCELSLVVPKEEEEGQDDEVADDATTDYGDTTLEQSSVKLDEEDRDYDPHAKVVKTAAKKSSASIKKEPTGERPKKKYNKRVFVKGAPRAKRDTPSLFKYPGAVKSLKWMQAEVQDAVVEEDEEDEEDDQPIEKEEVPKKKKPKLDSSIAEFANHKLPLQCPLCNGAFSSVVNFKAHFDEEHEDDVSPIQIKSESKEKTCPTCYVLIAAPDTLFIHTMRAHMGTTPPTAAAAAAPEQRVSQEERKAPLKIKRVKRVALYKCGFCPREFQKQATFINHEREHYGDLVNSCTFCGAKFDTFELMKEHMEQGHGENERGRCKFCDRMISNIQKDVHSCVVERLYKCPVPSCDRRFSVKSNANRHVRLVHKDFKMPTKAKETGPSTNNLTPPVVKKEPDQLPIRPPVMTPTKALTPAIPKTNNNSVRQYFHMNKIAVQPRPPIAGAPRVTATFVPKISPSVGGPKFPVNVVPTLSVSVVPSPPASAAAAPAPQTTPVLLAQKNPEGSFQRDFETTLKNAENIREGLPIFRKGIFLGTYNKIVAKMARTENNP